MDFLKKLFGVRKGSRSAKPTLLILLVNKTPPEGADGHISRLINELPLKERPAEISLQVTDSYSDEAYIATTAVITPLQKGIRANDDMTWHRSYSTADGIVGTQVFIYE